MSSVLSIATSGMQAATKRLDVSASNVANVMSGGPVPNGDPALVSRWQKAYVPKRVDQVETHDGGTRAIVGDVLPGYIKVYQPDAPFADKDGMVAMPDVDLAGEAVAQMVARAGFAYNAAVARSYTKMMRSLFDSKV